MKLIKESGKTPMLGRGYKDAAIGIGAQAGTWYEDNFQDIQT